jgi:hypothetical protein
MLVGPGGHSLYRAFYMSTAAIKGGSSKLGPGNSSEGGGEVLPSRGNFVGGRGESVGKKPQTAGAVGWQSAIMSR